MKKLSSINPTIVALGNYNGAYQKIKCKCSVCGYEWEAVPHNLLTKRACPNCAHSSTSYIEQFILHSFRKALGEKLVLSRDKTVIGEEIDVYIPHLRFAIEPGSWEYHKNKLSKDIRKKKLCENAGVKLIIIYYDYSGMPLDDPDIIVYKSDISLPKEHTTLTKLMENLFALACVKVVFSENDWERISDLAYLNSRRTTTAQFIERLSTKNPTIQVMGEYKGVKKKVLCRCKICNSDWYITPNDLLSGKSCPSCYNRRRGNKLRYSQNDFIQRVNKTNPNVIILGDYKGSLYRIECECRICRFRWNPIAGQLVSSRARGCPNCGGTRKLSTSTFISQMNKINPVTIYKPHVHGSQP